MKKELQIVATGQGWMDHDVSKETWSLLKAFLKGAKADRIFSMDGLNIQMIKDGHLSKDEVIERIGDVPFITNENFPLKQFDLDYFTNSVCYMIALAIAEGYQKIELYGVNQAGLFEYMEQRKGVEFWIGYALGKGIEVYINPPSSLLTNTKNTPYGYEDSEGLKTERKAKGGIKKVLDLVGYMSGYTR